MLFSAATITFVLNLRLCQAKTGGPGTSNLILGSWYYLFILIFYELSRINGHRRAPIPYPFCYAVWD